MVRNHFGWLLGSLCQRRAAGAAGAAGEAGAGAERVCGEESGGEESSIPKRGAAAASFQGVAGHRQPGRGQGRGCTHVLGDICPRHEMGMILTWLCKVPKGGTH